MKSFLRKSLLLLFLLITGLSTEKLYAQGSVNCQSSSAWSLGMDSSNIGRFIIGTDTFGTIGSHLYNPTVIDSYMLYSADTIILYVDSTYNVQEAGIMNTINDASAQVSLFIDYDGSMTYDLPQEFVWTDTSVPYVNYILNGTITIPSTVITGVPVMMRLILNNDTSANSASDSACGTYISGETEDFIVMFEPGGPEGVKNIQGGSSLQVSPNPSTGKFNLKLNNAAQLAQLQVSVMSVTGQMVYTKTYNNIKGRFSAMIDLSGMPKGLYFVQTEADGEKQLSKVVIQ
jgi:hypothetical protein